MNAVSHPTPKRTGEWYVVNTLAWISMFVLIFAIGMLVPVYLRGHLSTIELPLSMRVVGSLGVVAILLLWVRMLIDFLLVRPPKYSIAWGLFLVFGTFIGGLVYFWAVWHPRESVQ